MTLEERADKLLDNWCRNKGDYCPHLKALEDQIEKMKCCTNCKHTRTEYEHCVTDKHEKWELKE